ncbi:MAG: transcription antitermination factor NusB [Anaerovoracaceae bacterium]
MKRSEARELMMQLLFQMEAQKEFSEDIKTSFFKGHSDLKGQKEYIDTVFKNFIENRAAIDEAIDSASENWKLNRMGKVDLAVTRLAAAELLYMDDIPTSVSINEAVNLAKKFGSEDSGKFVNGILGRLAKQAEA